MTRDLTKAQRALFKDCLRWGEIGPDAEEVAGCHGAAFQRVVRALINKGLLNDNGSLSAAVIAECGDNFPTRQRWLGTTDLLVRICSLTPPEKAA